MSPDPDFATTVYYSTRSRRKRAFVALGITCALSIWTIGSITGLEALLVPVHWLVQSLRMLGPCIWPTWVSKRCFMPASLFHPLPLWRLVACLNETRIFHAHDVFVLTMFSFLDVRCKSSIKYTYEDRCGDDQDQARELTQTEGNCCLEARNDAGSLRAIDRHRARTGIKAGKEAVNRAHMIRLNPTPEQVTYFKKACGVARHCYNWALAQWKQVRAEDRRVKMRDLKREYNRIKREQFPWTLEVTKCAAKQEFSHVSAALTNFFRMKEEGT